MMIRFLTPVPMLLAIAMAIVMPPGSSSTHVLLDKRFFSVARLGPNRQPAFEDGPWPSTHLDNSNRRISPIWYCFEDANAARLATVVSDAVRLWQPALFPESSLTIALDPRCDGNPLKFCNELNGSGSPLIISAHGADFMPATTVGYNYRGRRNTLKFGGRYRDRDAMVVSMAHELGHAIGLEHEHQRPRIREGRQPQLRVQFTNLEAYDKGLRNVHSIVFQGTLDDDDKMEEVCKHTQLAQTYCKDIKPWIALRNEPDLVEGGQFDDKSIMNYGSFAGTGCPSGSDLEDAALVGLRYVNGQEHEYEIEQGTQPSAGDVARVKALYPLC